MSGNLTHINMKKLMLIVAAGAFISTSMVSCTKNCGHCEVNGTKGAKFCSTDNHVIYDAAVSSCATGGGTWVKQ